MRIRKAPAGAFVVVCLLASAAGFGRSQLPQYKQSDKVLHFVTFFLITLCFYWIIETNRRRVIHLTLFVCPLAMGVGSEIIQGILPNDREFDPYDILANAVGSIAALLLCSWYHKRMLERKRRAKQYQVVPGEDVDVELGENVNEEGQESGVVREGMTVEEELDNWDENAEDNWDPEEPNGGAETEQAGKTDSAAAAAAEQSAKKRDD
ncbi:VanZ-like protein [Botryosphaeria dothidea]|uniref:VanZ-like protein n=1 Tax=Botryosphaeria dothidea TaxID=55169 RepID=A0A8H4IWV8_9PEZI|nr:VanZ-like protein [Botryosphaeria dothidea]